MNQLQYELYDCNYNSECVLLTNTLVYMLITLLTRQINLSVGLVLLGVDSISRICVNCFFSSDLYTQLLFYRRSSVKVHE